MLSPHSEDRKIGRPGIKTSTYRHSSVISQSVQVNLADNNLCLAWRWAPGSERKKKNSKEGTGCLEFFFRGCRQSSEVKSTCCSGRAYGLGSQHPHGCSQPSLTPFGLLRHQMCMHCKYSTHRIQKQNKDSPVMFCIPFSS